MLCPALNLGAMSPIDPACATTPCGVRRPACRRQARRRWLGARPSSLLRAGSGRLTLLPSWPKHFLHRSTPKHLGLVPVELSRRQSNLASGARPDKSGRQTAAASPLRGQAAALHTRLAPTFRRGVHSRSNHARVAARSRASPHTRRNLHGDSRDLREGTDLRFEATPQSTVRETVGALRGARMAASGLGTVSQSLPSRRGVNSARISPKYDPAIARGDRARR